MLFTPFNFTFSLQRVAVYEWEPVPPADEPAPVRPPATCEDATSPAQQPQQPQGTLLPAMHLVFKGYEWASVAGCSTFPRPSFEDCYVAAPVVGDEQDSSDNERRARQHEVERRPRPAVAAPDQTNAANGTAPSDPSKPREP